MQVISMGMIVADGVMMAVVMRMIMVMMVCVVMVMHGVTPHLVRQEWKPACR